MLLYMQFHTSLKTMRTRKHNKETVPKPGVRAATMIASLPRWIPPGADQRPEHAVIFRISFQLPNSCFSRPTNLVSTCFKLHNFDGIKKLKGPSAQQTFILGVLVLQKWRSGDSRTNGTDGSLKSCVESVCSRFRVYMCTYIYIHIDIRKLTSDTTKQNGVGLRVGIKNDILSFTVTSKSSVFRSYDRFLGVCAASLKLLCEPPYAKGPCTEIVYTLALK